MNPADHVWNRAAMDGGGPEPREGDVALAAALLVHNLTMNGGLLDVVESVPQEELSAADEGYRWLRLDAAADVIVMVRREWENVPLGDLDAAEALEALANNAYDKAVPSDQTIVDAFQERFDAEPQAFAPL